jgi:hypothetical protein
MAGTHDDAVLVVELAKWGAMSGLAEALGNIFSDDFDPDAAELGDPRFVSCSASTRRWRPS